MQTEQIHNLSYVSADLSGFMNHLEQSYINRRAGAYIATVNPEIGYAAIKDKSYSDVLSSADFILPDGIGVVMMSKLTNNRLKSRIAGYDVFINLLKIANDKKKRVFLYGAKKEVNQAVADRISSEYPDINLVGCSDGYAKDKEAVAKRIAKSKPDMVFVALGYPHQERFIYQHRHLFPQAIAIGLGGSFDVFSGTVKRAPNWLIRLNLEWLYRLATNPSRWKRMMNIPKYAFSVLKEQRVQKQSYYPEQVKEQSKQIDA
ncbi:WecB/TagA/CpsF family glycosyltransferase [Bacillus swezeyi]|uniref:N-acetylglucosaminyldiphosphoundecaprenol N-acetyl-beta-D-mannosaminyltransferase n=1 Tax=Bacillus swezeyi TaxID=1925020 RepID=A0A1R1RYJ4_9BACI|nr:WecB/TagA/CpsF family glycosyltransferase [Bacillus swezeyi]MEC1259395.1 WecB/TagA/CpsF family glycosyltransferase [Bacillus swezeyi]MED2927643.1 WecB/TagA/CpsF family glycosyltransferase [Bacillus swezeyi]MED2962841.1 WecB/TagA/CpsF family glycosyltransferase [Bacillus swezeyi]MED3071705.1 WecB/TagA/CpsF family glycosyltransferase [Bacillus swezeyi]MED3080655.1 WecB/TagA/CpsF family glycosyltransferase [Bacillus swezeyi]